MFTCQNTQRGGAEVGGAVHEKAHHCFTYFTETFLKSTDALEASTAR